MALLVAGMLAFPPRVDASPIVSVGSATQVVGDTFTIPVSISGATSLTTFQFDLSYNNTILTAQSFTDTSTDFETAATTGGGFLTGITGFLLTGVVSGVADSMSFSSTGLTDGVLVEIVFKAIGAGTSSLTLALVELTDDGSVLDSGFTNGQVCVNPLGATTCGPTAAAPEPGTVALLAMGLAVLIMRRRRTSTC
jgi:hypothetical protein